jgi:hypothetical protein
VATITASVAVSAWRSGRAVNRAHAQDTVQQFERAGALVGREFAGAAAACYQ